MTVSTKSLVTYAMRMPSLEDDPTMRHRSMCNLWKESMAESNWRAALMAAVFLTAFLAIRVFL